MVADHDPEDVFRQSRQPLLGAGDLCAGDLPLRPVGLRRPGAHRVEADHRDLVVEEGRFGVPRDEPAVASERVEEAGEELEIGDVVIARHRDPGCGEPVEEGARLHVFLAPGPHGEVARCHDQVRRIAIQLGGERVDHRRIGAPEMQVGDMGDPSHRTGSGTITVSARGIRR
jgi:hypothetical protein